MIACEVRRGQVVAAGDEFVAIGGVELAEARDVRRAEADQRDGVGIGGVELLPVIVVLDGADLHVEGPEDREARRGLQRFLDALGAVLEHGEAGEAVADDDLALGRGAAELVDDHLAEDAAALGRLLADIGRLDRGAEQIELHDRHAAGDDVVEAVGHGIAGHRGRDSLPRPH